MGTANGIGLSELLLQLRGELDEAQARLRQSGVAPAIDWESAEVEISFGVTKEAKAEGGANFYVFTIGSGAKHKSEQVHRLKLQLRPHVEPKVENAPYTGVRPGLFDVPVPSTAVAELPPNPPGGTAKSPNN